jgi:hypothetical protein
VGFVIRLQDGLYYLELSADSSGLFHYKYLVLTSTSRDNGL